MFVCRRVLVTLAGVNRNDLIRCFSFFLIQRNFEGVGRGVKVQFDHADALLNGVKKSNECKPNTQRQKGQAQKMTNDDGGRYLVGLNLKFVGEHEIEDSAWQTSKQNQCATF